MAKDTDYVFDTWDAARALEGPGDGGHRDASRRADPHTNKWAGSTLEEVREYVRNGWDKGLVAIEVDGRDPTLSERDVPAFEFALGEDGQEVDIASWMAGDPNCMGDMRVVPLPKPLVRIGVDMSVSADVSPQQMLRVGRSVLVAVERLRAAGFPTSVDVLFSVWSTESYNHEERCTIRVKVQEAGQPIHAGLLAFWVSHPAALRRAMFALSESLGQDERDRIGFYYSSGYGKPMQGYKKAEYDEWAPSANMPDHAVAQWVRDVLSRHGLEGGAL